VTSVYRQATVERQNIKRKELKDKPSPLFVDVPLLQDGLTEMLI
jgi:hypothetical protein